MGLKLKSGTAAFATSINETLEAGEIGYETDTGKMKVGDGVTAWTALPYFPAASGGASGTAGGDLTGTYPNPTIGAGKVGSTKIANNAVTNTQLGLGAVQDGNVAAANKDGAAATPSMRTLGTGSAQAAAGNDTRLSDARIPTAHASTHVTGGADPVTPASIGAVATSDASVTNPRAGVASDWAASTVYQANQIVVVGGLLFRALADHASGASFTPANWLQLSSPVSWARRTSDLARTSTATVTADTKLTVPVAAGGLYRVDGFLIIDGPTAADFAIGWTGPTGATMDWTPDGLTTATSSPLGSIQRVYKSITGTGSIGTISGTKTVASPSGILTVGSTSGNLTLTWAQDTLTAGNTTLYTGSTLTATRLA